MLSKTNGIVFHSVDYSDTSVIASIYTESYGLQSFMVSGVHGKKSGIKAGLFQPLSLVEMVIYHNEKKQLHRIKEIKISFPYKDIPFDIAKSSVIIFINEILYKTIREEEHNPVMFEFVSSSLRMLDLQTHSIANFHLVFLLRLSMFLGFYPRLETDTGNNYFDLQEGVFSSQTPLHPYYLHPNESKVLLNLMRLDLSSSHSLVLSAFDRKYILEKLILYFELHLPFFKQVQSHKVLEEVFE